MKSENYKKWDIRYIAFAVALVLLYIAAGTALGMGIKHNGWFAAQQETDPVEDVGGEMIVTETTPRKGISFLSRAIPIELYEEYGISPLALSAQTITAKVKADDNTYPDYFQYVTFDVAWATGGDSHLSTVIDWSTTDNSITVSCKDSFTTQIIVTATSDIDSTKSGQITLDYAPSLSGVWIKASPYSGVRDGMNQVFEGTTIPIYLQNYTNMSVTPGPQGAGWAEPIMGVDSEYCSFGLGSIENTVTSITVSMKYSDEFIRQLVIADSSMPVSSQTYTTSSSFGQWEVLHGMLVDSVNANRYLGSSLGSGADRSVVLRFMDMLESVEDPIEVTLKVELQYGGTKTYHFYLSCDVAPVETSVSDVEFSGDVIFYE